MNALALGLVILIAVAVLAGALGWWVRSFWCKGGKEGFDGTEEETGDGSSSDGAESPSLEGAILCERELIDYAGEILQDIRDYVVMLKEQTPSAIAEGPQSARLEFIRTVHVVVRFIMLSMIDVEVDVLQIMAELITAFQASNKDNAYASLLSKVDSLGPTINHYGVLVRIPYFLPYATTREQRDMIASQLAQSMVDVIEENQRKMHEARRKADVTNTISDEVTYEYPSIFNAMNMMTNGTLQTISQQLAMRSSHDSRYLLQVLFGNVVMSSSLPGIHPNLQQSIQNILSSLTDGVFAMNRNKVAFSSCDEASMTPGNQADAHMGQKDESPAYDNSTQQAAADVESQAQNQAKTSETEMDGTTGTSAGPSGFNWDNAVVFVRKA